MSRTKPHLCRVCGEDKPEKFYPNRKSICKPCRNKRDKEAKISTPESRANYLAAQKKYNDKRAEVKKYPGKTW